MSREPRDLEWDAIQIDRALDFVNVIFGALLSAYIGVEIAQGDLSLIGMFNIVFILGMMTMAIYNYRVVWHIFAGTIDAKLRWNIVAIVGACVAMGSALTQTSLDQNFFIIVLAGWLVTSLLLTAGYITKRIQND